MYNAVFIAVSRGGVVVAREVIISATEDEFMKRLDTFKKMNTQQFCTFLMEKELEDLLRRIEQKQGGMF